MSTDWEKYSTPVKTRRRAKKPECNGVVHFIAGNLRKLELNVKHAPISDPDLRIDNQAHTDVNGTNCPIQEDTELRLKLLDEITWDIYPDEPIEA